MTEELKKEAEKYIIGQRQHYTMDFDEVHRLVVGFADYVTKELQEENKLLIQENEEIKKGLGCETCQMHLEYKKLNSKIAELEAQIEKMKSDVREMAEQADKNGNMLALKRMSELFEKWKL